MLLIINRFKFVKFFDVCFLILVLSTGLTTRASWAQTPPPNTPSTTPNVETSPAELYNAIRSEQINSPAKIILNQGTSFIIPSGYSFIPRDNAAILLNMMGNDAGDGLLGLVVGTNDAEMSWFTVLRQNESGYISDKNSSNINQNAILQSIRNRLNSTNSSYSVAQGVPQYTVEDVEWIVPPTYNNKSKVLSWLLQTKTQGSDLSDLSQQGINLRNILLYRYGFIQINTATSMENIILAKTNTAEIINAITFEKDFLYDSFDKAKDIPSEILFAHLIAGEGSEGQPSEPIAISENDKTNSLILFILLLVVGVAFILRDVFIQKKSKSV